MGNAGKCAVIAAMLATPAMVIGQNLVTNGEFELPAIATCFVHVAAGTGGIAGWQVEAPVGANGVDIISRAFCGEGAAHCLNQAIDMAGTPGRGSIYQDLATTPGASYALSFFVAGLEPHAGGLTIEWNGAPLDTISTPGGSVWQLRTYTVTATAAVTRLKFIGNVDGNRGSFLDSVVVDPSGEFPCPADVDGDGSVGLSDLAILLSNFGETSGALPSDGDLDCDADVDLGDLAALLSSFGTICP